MSQRILNNLVTLDNLCSPGIVALSQVVDKQIVREQRRMIKNVDKASK